MNIFELLNVLTLGKIMQDVTLINDPESRRSLNHQLFWATKCNCIRTVKHLLIAGAKADFIILGRAVFNRYIAVLKLFLIYGADVNAANLQGRTLLHCVANYGNRQVRYDKVARLLIDYGADIHAVDSENKTPLHYAARSGDAKVAKLLIDYGANIYATDFKGGIPIHYAIDMGHVEVVKFLTKHPEFYICNGLLHRAA